MFNIKKRAFTLSEVLIAMSIIGVIAAITVPRVMNNTQSSANVLKLKRAYLSSQEALRISAARAGYDMADITRMTTSSTTPRNAQDLLALAFDANVRSTTYQVKGRPITYNSSDVPQLADYSSTTDLAVTNDLVYASKNGVSYTLKNKTDMTDGCTAMKPCVMYIDINGDSAPNEIIMCTSGADTIGTVAANADANYAEPEACTVDDGAITDIYPFFIYDADIRPATSAVAAILER